MTAKKALRFVVAVVFICTLLSIASLFTYCDQPRTFNWPGQMDSGPANCSVGCHCEETDTTQYFPICGSDGKTYYSPCMAGCGTHDEGTYSNCTCIEGGEATQGICSYSCDHLYWFAIVSGLRSLFGTLAIIPKVTVMIRSVEERDKSLAMGLSSFLSSLLGWLLGPILFGMTIDGICDLWDETCGVRGRCLLYDNDLFRWRLMGFSSLGIAGSLFFQVCALLYSWKTGCLDDIDIDGRKDELDGKKDEREMSIIKKENGTGERYEKEGGKEEENAEEEKKEKKNGI